MAQNLETYARASRTIPVVHAEAFQLMLYRETETAPATAKSFPRETDKAGGRELWIWNSRDGVTPFGVGLEDAEYRHAMHGYPTRYSAVLPAQATHVFVDYDREAWADMLRRRWQRMAEHPKSEWHDPEEFKARFPTAESFAAIDTYRPGEPRLITREQFLETTASWMGRHVEEPDPPY
jgi:hypothetical protein